ncbi:MULTISPECIES: F0F1 ATP synthase subunit epsilon [Clostridium]|uniref:ATP synthase epsilon chain n=2 Tax=Clostridium novyi TaxID=1542 RepID=ATPE_CLONN|nr:MULTISPECIES: F0F1 ATP synthase subunit epsilon [Clostridium]A0Q2Z3.1 RecName: Full=ATP synthase epsilon chain; AltName: Full=ATP synthase F1 sector epsilon subunit; AltName: Full=F-ATPase epsilon subunit [Clostridium novyi NT]ABK62502.1 ATP synthase F1, epsilon subunit [Clostridium novyi NT]KEH87006.1 ATP synthase F0F1 subunit epsilon [Clostridium novyi A str. NCTC 538]KEH91100.1 ATP synthase F0F1 subunit epsilon [Clostridium novyi A str. BKT29909]KEH94749.1 ATP synthase F0F1 subunit epsil
MAKTFKLKIVTPEKIFFEGEAEKINLETTEGKTEILANHSAFIAMLVPTNSKLITDKGEEKKFFLSSGILKVNTEEVVILCDAAEWPEEIDKKRAEEAKKRAEERLSKKDGVDIKRAEFALMRAIKRIEMV